MEIQYYNVFAINNSNNKECIINTLKSVKNISIIYNNKTMMITIIIMIMNLMIVGVNHNEIFIIGGL